MATERESKITVPVPEAFRRRAWIKSLQQYEEMYKQSIEDPSTFWGDIASQFYWKRKWDTSKPICSYNFDIRHGPISIEWFKGAYTNICYNALDKHVNDGRGDSVAILWEGNEVGHELRVTYKDMLRKTCQLANYLRKRGVKKGDRVCIYMPMIPEILIAMLACARIGAIHSVVFGGFSSESLAGRILDCQSDVLLACSAVQRGNKSVNLKAIVDEALKLCLQKENFQPGTCLIYDNVNAVLKSKVNWVVGRDFWWHYEVASCYAEADVEWMDAEDPLFLLYTSGSSGKPKGVLHTVGGYMVYSATTFKYVFDYRPGDIYWCTADCGWITGHTYICYGPFLNGATQVVFEGVPTYPTPSRWWQIIDKYKVSILYTAPTAIRSLEALGDDYLTRHSRSSLRLLGTVGEAINAKAWWWYHRVVGEGRCMIVDTWWQTETGGIMISPLPGAWDLKPGSATLPFFGVQPVVLDPEGKEQHGACSGHLCITGAWPGIARSLYGDHPRFAETYFATWPGLYVTGDGCQGEANGFITLTGRVDDVVNVSGHRISIGEVESALTSHKACAETAAVAFDHDVKGQGIYAFVTLVEGASPTEKLKDEIKAAVRREIGSFAVPDEIQWAPGLPKTRSGKIIRRILRKIAANQFDELGDVSSLADPTVVDQLVETKRGSTCISRL